MVDVMSDEPDDCPSCGGYGAHYNGDYEHPCRACNGSGLVYGEGDGDDFDEPDDDSHGEWIDYAVDLLGDTHE